MKYRDAGRSERRYPSSLLISLSALPEVYNQLVHDLNARKTEREEFVQQIVAEVSKHMKNADIEAKVYGRVKHFFSIYKKMVNQNKTLDQVYDLFAVRLSLYISSVLRYHIPLSYASLLYGSGSRTGM